MANETRRRPIGLVVEGISEFHALPVFVRQLDRRAAGAAVFQGQGVHMTPQAVARRAFPSVRAQLKKNLGRVIVVLDREFRDACAPGIAGQVQNDLMQMLADQGADPSIPVVVVCADRMFENWLLADRSGLATHKLVRTRIGRQPGNVDGVDGATELSKLMVSGASYRKGQLSGQLAEHVRVKNVTVQRRSRSLQKFVKEVLAGSP